MIKLTGLTAHNIDALLLTQDKHGLSVDLGKTTATFYATAREVVAGIDRAIAANPSNGHPRSSLYAVRRKAAARVGKGA